MYILGIETTGKFASVSIFEKENSCIIGEEVSGEERSHLKGLIPMIDTLLKKTKIDKKELSYIACSIGPGSFTGIRIGVATARALAQGLNIPLIPVSTLEGFLYKEEVVKKIEEGLPISVILNARRMQVYGLVYYNGEMILKPGPYMLDDIIDATKQFPRVYFTGDGVVSYSKYLTGERYILGTDIYQDSKSINILGAKNINKAVRYNELEPDYMRITEAEAKLMSGELKITKMRQD